MPRAARVVIPGCPHHVTQKGNNGQDVFFADDDRAHYLELLRKRSEEFGLVIEGYCLMTNHLHLIATPTREDSLAKAIGRTNFHYTRRINHLHARRGHLWQDRFFSAPLDDQWFWNALIYVERNPVRAGLVRRAWDWPWSSAAGHVDGRDRHDLLAMATWRERLPPDGDWRDAISREQDGAVVEHVRAWGNRGCPMGADSFISKLETRLARRLRPAPRGRPKKAKTKNGYRPD